MGRCVCAGELAFHKMMNPIGWAARPLCDRLHHLDASIPITFLYGEVRAPPSSLPPSRIVVCVVLQLTISVCVHVWPVRPSMAGVMDGPAGSSGSDASD